MEIIVVFVTTSSQDEAETMAMKLLEGHWVACANILPDMTSIFSWQGEICREKEVLMILKTRQDLFDQVARVVKQYHHYSVPEIIAVPLVSGTEDYLMWVRENTKGKNHE